MSTDPTCDPNGPPCYPGQPSQPVPTSYTVAVFDAQGNAVHAQKFNAVSSNKLASVLNAIDAATV